MNKQKLILFSLQVIFAQSNKLYLTSCHYQRVCVRMTLKLTCLPKLVLLFRGVHGGSSAERY